jgi:FkbM family methyltransferase
VAKFRELLKRTAVGHAVSERRSFSRLRTTWTQQDAALAALWSRFVRPGDLCFDVGANVGNKTRVLLALGAKVVAVEPQAQCATVLRGAYGGRRGVRVLQKALGEAPGTGTLFLSNVHQMSSLSPEWVSAVQATRFSFVSWATSQIVELTTLDEVINEYGVPSFIKIDCEGFEGQVLGGLSRSIRHICFEFNPEYLDDTLKCLDHLQSLGRLRVNYSLGETATLALDDWISAEAIVPVLKAFHGDASVCFGDVYVSLEED